MLSKKGLLCVKERESWTSLSIACSESNAAFLSVQLFTGQNAYWIIYIRWFLSSSIKRWSSFSSTLINDYSRKVWAYPLKYNSDLFAIFTEWKVMIGKHTEGG